MMITWILFITWFFFVWLAIFRRRAFAPAFIGFIFSGGSTASAMSPRILDTVLAVNLYMVLLFVFLISVAIANRVNIFKRARSILGIAGFVVLCIIGATFLINVWPGITEPSSLIPEIVAYSCILLSLILGPDIIRDKSDLFRIGDILVACLVAHAIAAAYQMVTGTTFMTFYYESSQLNTYSLNASLPEVLPGVYRVRGLFDGHAPFSFASTIAIVYIAALLHARPSIGKFRRQFYVLGFLIGLILVFLTFQRGSWFVVACVLVLSTMAISRHRVRLLVLVGLAAMILVAIPATTARFENVDSSNSVDLTTGRVVLWVLLMREASGGVLVGNGLGSYMRVAASALGGEMIPSHNDYLQIMIESGWVAAFSVLLFLLVLGLRTLRMSVWGSTNVWHCVTISIALLLLAQTFQSGFENMFGVNWKFLPFLLAGACCYRFQINGNTSDLHLKGEVASPNR